LIKTYSEKTKVTPIDRYLEKRLFDAIAILNDSKIMIKYIIIKKIDPKKPNSSPNIVNIKSLCISGKKLR
jgi:hypothetical protein